MMVGKIREKCETFPKVALMSILVAVLFLNILVAANYWVRVAKAQVDVDFEIISVEWGADPTPGATDVPLTITVKNLSNRTIKCTGILYLKPPFRNYLNDSYIAKSVAHPTESPYLEPTEEIPPYGTFTFDYRLNIALNATKGYYSVNLTIMYEYEESVDVYEESLDVWQEGGAKNYTVILVIYNRAPEVESYTPASTDVNIQVGSSVQFSVVCTDPDNDSLNYEWKLDGVVVSRTNNYTYTPKSEDVGQHTLEFTVDDGNLSTSLTWTITVTRAPVTSLSVSTYYLYAGFENQIHVNISNSEWNGRVDVSIGVQNPLVLKSNQTLMYKDVKPNDTIIVPITVFVPEAAMGNALAITVTVSYMDVFGNSYRDSFTINFMIRGRVWMIVYDVSVAPETAKPGDMIQVSGTLLNKGTVTAKFVNVSIVPSDVFLKTKDWMSFVGEVDVNSPTPFTVCAYVNSSVNSSASKETYILTIKIEFYDDLYNKFEMYYNVSVTVQEVEQQSTPVKHPVQQFVEQGGLMASAVGVIAVTLVLIYLRRMVGGGA